VPRSILILSALLILSSGCRSPRYNAEDQPDPGAQPPAPAPVATAPEPEVTPPAPDNPPPRVSPSWVTVSDWANAMGLQRPHRVSGGERPVFEVTSERGAFTFQIGTRDARFDGVNLLLGFEPCVFAGEPCLHRLDVEKNLEPLLTDAPIDLTEYTRIVIDPGHGGSNTGTRSADGSLEKDYTLDWALRLRPLLEANGWTVALTRTNDVELALSERIDFADAVEADVFISLHFNASGGGSYQAGLETYCLTPQGIPSNLTRGFQDDPTVSYPNNAFDDGNLQVAVQLHRALLNVNGGLDRGIRKARFMGVLRGQTRPAVLVEGGFLSNPAEAARVADPDYRQQLAEALADGLMPGVRRGEHLMPAGD
jgi:N-acetylmuramoyl-L-alanine amidase